MKNLIYIILVALLLSCSKKEADQPNKAYRIACNVWTDKEGDNYEVFTMNLDGTDQVNITNLEGVEWTYRAYDDQVLYISDRDTCNRCYFLYETDALGSQHRKIGGPQLRDSWMSTRNGGQEIIVNPKVDGDSAFYIINRSGELVQKIYTGLPYYSDPYFSPDGKEIVFRGSKKRFKANIGYQDELYIVGVDGSNLRQLTYYPEGDTTANWYSYHAGPPFWEPNRNVITYHSKQQGGSYLFQINPDGSGLKKLTPDSIPVGWHSWSPDGTMITFDSNTGENDEDMNFDIFIMEYESGEITRITSDTLFEQAPVFVEAMVK
ncbi:TolB family protein [Ekhidna sp.]|uniref:TolB family protein n=1 Tax=Ekhidna sp. TaxID=2608089 RepID=UPI003B510A5D